MSERRVTLFRESQVVLIPLGFELPGDEAILRKENNRLVIEALPKPSLIDLLKTWEPIDEDIGPIDDPPPEPVEI